MTPLKSLAAPVKERLFPVGGSTILGRQAPTGPETSNPDLADLV
jgi:hypothetical protein